MLIHDLDDLGSHGLDTSMCLFLEMGRSSEIGDFEYNHGGCPLLQHTRVGYNLNTVHQQHLKTHIVHSLSTTSEILKASRLGEATPFLHGCWWVIIVDLAGDISHHIPMIRWMLGKSCTS